MSKRLMNVTFPSRHRQSRETKPEAPNQAPKPSTKPEAPPYHEPQKEPEMKKSKHVGGMPGGMFNDDASGAEVSVNKGPTIEKLD